MFKIVSLFCLILILFSACAERITESPIKTPQIKQVSPTQIYITQDMEIIGEGFTNSIEAYLLFTDETKILKKDAKDWNDSYIKINLPFSLTSSKFKIVTPNGESDWYEFHFQKFPTIETTKIFLSSFEMGNNFAAIDERPKHLVDFNYELEVQTSEITQRDYEIVMNKRPSIIANKELPVSNISWFDAIEYCNKLSELQGLDKAIILESGSKFTIDFNSNGWRLATEAEWEYLCRAGTNTDFSGNGDINEIGWYSSNSGYLPHYPKGKIANQFGLYDMHGNMYEWCFDTYHENFYSIASLQNPLSTDKGSQRVIRGGAFDSGIRFTRSFTRNSFSQDSSSHNIGFRIVRKTK